MRRRLVWLLTIALVTTLATTGLGAPPALGQAADPVFFTIDAAADGRGSVYTLVIDTTTDVTFVLQRDATDGEVLARFADSDGWLDGAIAVARDGRIYLSGNDGAIRVYAKGGRNGFRQVATWPVSVPGVDGIVTIGQVAPLRGGLTAVGTVVLDSTAPDRRPRFSGVVILDRQGRIVGTWATPRPAGLPRAGYIGPISITPAPRGDVYVYALSCTAGACPVAPLDDGFFYRLDLSREPRRNVVVTPVDQWQIPNFIMQEVTAIGDASFIAVQSVLGGGPGENLAFQVMLTDTGLDTTGAVVSPLGRVPEAATITPVRGRTTRALYLVEGPPVSSSDDAAFVQRYRPIEGEDGGTLWIVDGDAWIGSWGPEGPPLP